MPEVTYTSIYRSVYESLQCNGSEHKDIHKAAIGITDNIWNVYVQSNYDCNMKILDVLVNTLSS